MKNLLLIYLIFIILIAGSTQAFNWQRSTCPEDFDSETCESQNEVCGIREVTLNNDSDGESYENYCSACSADGIDYFVDKSCSDKPEGLRYCDLHEEDGEQIICDEANNETVCAHFRKDVCLGGVNAVTSEYHCNACWDSVVDYTTPGACQFDDMIVNRGCPNFKYDFHRKFLGPRLPFMTADCNVQINPVCAIKYNERCDGTDADCRKTSKNFCASQEVPWVQALVNVACEAIPPQIADYCPFPHPRNWARCDGENDEAPRKVCGHLIKGKCTKEGQHAITFDSYCQACQDPRVDYTTLNACSPRDLQGSEEDKCDGEAALQLCEEEDQNPIIDFFQASCSHYFDPKCNNGVGSRTTINACEKNNLKLSYPNAIFREVFDLGETGYYCKNEGCEEECQNRFDGEVCGFLGMNRDCDGENCMRNYNTYCDAALDGEVMSITPGRCCDLTEEKVCATFRLDACPHGQGTKTYLNECVARNSARFIFKIEQGECQEESVQCKEDYPIDCELNTESSNQKVCASFLQRSCGNLFTKYNYPNRCVAAQDQALFIEDGECPQNLGCSLGEEEENEQDGENVSSCPTFKAPLCALKRGSTCTPDELTYKTFDNYCKFYETLREDDSWYLYKYGECSYQTCDDVPCWASEGYNSQQTQQYCAVIYQTYCPSGYAFFTFGHECLKDSLNAAQIKDGPCIFEGCVIDTQEGIDNNPDEPGDGEGIIGKDDEDIFEEPEGVNIVPPDENTSQNDKKCLKACNDAALLCINDAECKTAFEALITCSGNEDQCNLLTYFDSDGDGQLSLEEKQKYDEYIGGSFYSSTKQYTSEIVDCFDSTCKPKVQNTLLNTYLQCVNTQCADFINSDTANNGGAMQLSFLAVLAFMVFIMI